MWFLIAFLPFLPHRLFPGETSIVPSWQLHPSQNLATPISQISLPSYNTSSGWLPVSARGTVFAGLLENGLYNDTHLFYSDNLDKTVDYSMFKRSWVYRHEFTLAKQPGQFYFLRTNGITSRADVWVNGKVIADKNIQVGAYGGMKFDISDVVKDGANVVVVEAYPTNYLRDFAMGFVDWNPYPPDNGTGIWRNVELMQTGAVSLSTPRVKTDFEYPWQSTVTVTVKVDAANHGNQTLNATLNAVMQAQDGSSQIATSQTISLEPGQVSTIPMVLTLRDSQIWWPKQWGAQPLYLINATATVSGSTSDKSSTTFGVRHVTSTLNAHNDTQFSINSHPFLVLGAGYTTDIFYRFNTTRLRQQFQLVLDMGLNTIRLEGKQEHPELYSLADEMGLMVIAGWECCDKWEGWIYNDEADGVIWTDADYGTANKSMRHEAEMMQSHPSMLAFLVGSDFWPDERATKIYVDALQELDWGNPVIASAAKRSYPELLGPSGMKMDGPYDWVSPNYWYREGGELGAAGGFGSELGAGVGTPEMGSLKKFLSPADMDDLWQRPDMGLYHMSTNLSSFYTRELYNWGLANRTGEIKGLEDYLWKAQFMDYEATRAQVEANAVRKVAQRPSTGMIYWMLQGAWPNLHWQLFDYYLAGAGAYYGAKMGSRMEHVIYDYEEKDVWMVSHALNSTGTRNVTMELMALNGTSLARKSMVLDAAPNTAQMVEKAPGLQKIKKGEVAFLKLTLRTGMGDMLSRNVYWISANDDVLDWENSDWYYTPVTEYANLTALFRMHNATVMANHVGVEKAGEGTSRTTVTIENTSEVPAFLVRMNLVSGDEKEDVVPVMFEDNYVTLFPGESMKLGVRWEGEADQLMFEVSGVNVGRQELQVGETIKYTRSYRPHIV